MIYSVRNESTGFDVAAFTDWKLTVTSVIKTVIQADTAKIHQLKSVL